MKKSFLDFLHSPLLHNVASAAGIAAYSALASHPDPKVSATIAALSAVYTVAHAAVETKKIDAAQAIDAVQKVAAAKEAIAPKPEVK